VLEAEHDFVTLRTMEGWQLLPQQRLVVFPEVAHHALLETPEICSSCLENFLQEQETAMNLTSP